MKALIFGASGQDGYYLANACRLRKIEVIGVSPYGSMVTGDVADYVTVRDLIRQYMPTYVFHLAARSTTRHEALFDNHAAISTGTLNILEAVKEYVPTAKVFLAQSGVQFKNSGKPISEFDEFEASSPYAVARIQSVFAARYYRSLGIKVYNGYLFHHESPLRPACHVSQLVVHGVQKILHGSSDVIELGNISVEKEWSFAGDIVEGILTLVGQDIVFEAVIGSGMAYSIQNWIELCFGYIGKDWKKFVVTKNNFVPEYQRLVSNPQTIFALGWSPIVTFAQLAEMMINQPYIDKEKKHEVFEYSTGSFGG